MGSRQVVLSVDEIAAYIVIAVLIGLTLYVLYVDLSMPLRYIGSYPVENPHAVDLPYRSRAMVYAVDPVDGTRTYMEVNGFTTYLYVSGTQSSGYVDIYVSGPDIYVVILLVAVAAGSTLWIYIGRSRLLSDKRYLASALIVAALAASAYASMLYYMDTYNAQRSGVYGTREPVTLTVNSTTTGAVKLGILDVIDEPSIISVASDKPFAVIIAYYEQTSEGYRLVDSRNVSSLTTSYTGYVEPLGSPDKGRNVLLLQMLTSSMKVSYRKIYFVEKNPEPSPVIKLAPSVPTLGVFIAIIASAKKIFLGKPGEQGETGAVEETPRAGETGENGENSGDSG